MTTSPFSGRWHTLSAMRGPVEFPLGGAALGRQLKLADARGARFAVLVGPGDRARARWR